MAIVVEVKMDESGDLLDSISTRGHFENSFICSAASHLLRVLPAVLEDEKIEIDGDAKKPGEFDLVVKSCGGEKREALRAISNFVVMGLLWLAKEAEDMDLRISK